MKRLALALCLGAAPAAAEGEMRPAPDYFVAAVMETSTAQILARACPILSINPGRMSARSEEALVMLAEDGFTADRLEEMMEDPTEAIAVLQDAFLAKHGLAEGASSAAVCEAGRAEIAEGSAIGILLLEVEE